MPVRSSYAPISIHPPRAGWDTRGDFFVSVRLYFNPPTPCGVGQDMPASQNHAVAFQSTHPVRGGTEIAVHPLRTAEFQSTHPVRGGTTGLPVSCWRFSRFQSTHPVRGGTLHHSIVLFSGYYFNPPTPCGVGRQSICSYGVRHHFNPPTPCGVGLGVQIISSLLSDFNPPTPCGVGPAYSLMLHLSAGISIHPPRAGWDGSGRSGLSHCTTFQSTHPVRGGTLVFSASLEHNTQFQSTHPVRGGTAGRFRNVPHKYYFNPPTPCGVGRRRGQRQKGFLQFQSTHPVRGGTISRFSGFLTTTISIHPPRAGWDPL